MSQSPVAKMTPFESALIELFQDALYKDPELRRTHQAPFRKLLASFQIPITAPVPSKALVSSEAQDSPKSPPCPPAPVSWRTATWVNKPTTSKVAPLCPPPPKSSEPPAPIKAAVPSVAQDTSKLPPSLVNWRAAILELEKKSPKTRATRSQKSVSKSRSRSRSPVEYDDPATLMSEDEASVASDASDASDASGATGGSEDYTDLSSADGDDNDYITVTRGKRKKTKSPVHATKAKKVTADTTPNPQPPSTSPDVQATPASVTASPRLSRPHSPMETTSNNRSKFPRPPPVFLQDKARWNDVSKSLVDLKINFTSATSCQNGIKITVPGPSEYRALTRFLKDKNFPFHTYALPEDRPTRVIIRRVPKEIPTEDIREDLLSQKVPVLAVHRLHKARGGQQYDMVLVVCSHTQGHNPIFKISSVCSLSGISIEKPHRPYLVGQCHRCQLYGHSQTNCYATPRCVKCLGNHGTKDCPRPKDLSECTEPPSCVLCGQVGHPASYRGCPKAPKIAPKIGKRFDARQQREAPSANAPPTQNPPRLAPQRNSPWDKLNHLSVAPQPTPQTIPGLMDHPISAPIPLPVPSASAAHMPPAQSRQVASTTSATASPPQKPRRCVAMTIISAYKIWMTDAARALAAEIDAASEISAVASGPLFDRYPTITEELDNLVYRNGEWVRR